MKRGVPILTVLLIATSTTWADGPRDNDPKRVRKIPREGVKVPAKKRTQLISGLRKLQQRLGRLRRAPINPQHRPLIPDVEVFHRAVADALKYREFFRPREIDNALRLLDQGIRRADALLSGKGINWPQQKGLVVRAYRSKLDHTAQPYGLVIPTSYNGRSGQRYRLDVWFHGRGETLSEVNFLHARQRSSGRFTPRDTIVLHPYGRYSNAFKFAGEVDVLEAIESVKRRYRIDPERISVRGFSMGGAACWQFAVHYADRWFAAQPGAGFSETPEFLRVFQKETLRPTWYEKKLWRWYDCTDWAENLMQCPTVVYSGEKDSQKQAADIMEKSLKRVGVRMVHIIGKGMGHGFDRRSSIEIDRRLDSLARGGRVRVPRRIHFTTYTLRYNRMHWITVDRLFEHWEKAAVNAQLNRRGVSLKTRNVRQLTLHFAPGDAPWHVLQDVQLAIDGQMIPVGRPMSDRSLKATLHRTEAGWRVGTAPAKRLAKRHGLQGPVDDAFMDSFLFVTPTGKAAHPRVGRWAQAELQHAITHWRQQFRGHARIKKDTDVTAQDIRSSNLVLWGDPSSNQVLKKIAAQLPIGWGKQSIEVGQQRYDADKHAVICIYPNPLNPQRYVVLNSCFTYREYAYLNNARQVPKLPDWAIVDLRVAPDTLWPGKIVNANFFNESWQLKRDAK